MRKETFDQLPEKMASVILDMVDNGVDATAIAHLAITTRDVEVTLENQDQLVAVKDTFNELKGFAGVDKRLMFGLLSKENPQLVEVVDLMNGRTPKAVSAKQPELV